MATVKSNFQKWSTRPTNRTTRLTRSHSDDEWEAVRASATTAEIEANIIKSRIQQQKARKSGGARELGGVQCVACGEICFGHTCDKCAQPCHTHSPQCSTTVDGFVICRACILLDAVASVPLNANMPSFVPPEGYTRLVDDDQVVKDMNHLSPQSPVSALRRSNLVPTMPAFIPPSILSPATLNARSPVFDPHASAAPSELVFAPPSPAFFQPLPVQLVDAPEFNM
eukprot:gnl/Spiro4/3040_TR1497_c0_g1_i1.p1 gnl/Spiro4/3040_TR1497_c0_g1~~gnl/Spiro4/3040_TR1497_c0_g1_i1.p1  ORF type:complete len:226 (+),score=50.29 gnl/Spiro4/3040_TR1497_c0_g1_i1:172-849(+)